MARTAVRHPCLTPRRTDRTITVNALQMGYVENTIQLPYVIRVTPPNGGTPVDLTFNDGACHRRDPAARALPARCRLELLASKHPGCTHLHVSRLPSPPQASKALRAS